jgi:uncharacterized protein (TIGR02118 family)
MIKNPLLRRVRLKAMSAVVAACLTAPAWVSADAGRVTPDVKVYAFIVKKHGLTDEQFHAHWREPHGRLTKKVPQIKRYLQNHGIGSVPTVPGLAPTPYLGIPTIWVENVGKLEEINRDPGFVEVHEDELNLLERDQLAWLITRETVIADGPAQDDISSIPTKVMLLLKQKHGISEGQFRSQIASTATTADRLRGSGRVTYALPAAEAYTTESRPPFDGVIEISFANDRACSKAWERHGQEILTALASAADIGASRGFLAHEERVIWPPFPR